MEPDEQKACWHCEGGIAEITYQTKDKRLWTYMVVPLYCPFCRRWLGNESDLTREDN